MEAIQSHIGSEIIPKPKVCVIYSDYVRWVVMKAKKHAAGWNNTKYDFVFLITVKLNLNLTCHTRVFQQICRTAH